MNGPHGRTRRPTQAPPPKYRQFTLGSGLTKHFVPPEGFLLLVRIQQVVPAQLRSLVGRDPQKLQGRNRWLPDREQRLPLAHAVSEIVPPRAHYCDPSRLVFPIFLRAESGDETALAANLAWVCLGQRLVLSQAVHWPR